MVDFFKKRLSLHQKQMMKYLRYVFNDHFVIVCTFLLGGAGLYYSNFLKTLPAGLLWNALVVILVLVAALHIGSFVTLTQPADLVFLLPKEKQMEGYLKQAFKYSCWFPFVALFLISGVAMPLYVVYSGRGFDQFFYFVVILWLLKLAHLDVQRSRLYFEGQSKERLIYGLWLLISTVAVSTAVFVRPVVGLLLAILFVGGGFVFMQKMPIGSLDWQLMIEKEKSRQHRIYQFINLFTDVPQITATVKRRKYLDGWLRRIRYRKENTYLYLYARRMLRGSEYSGLYLRLVIIGSVMLYFVKDRWFSLALGVLFIYVIGFQLVPLYNQFQYMVLTHLYPVAAEQKQKALQKLLLVLLLVVAVLFGGVAATQLGSWLDRGIVAVGFLAMVYLFVYLYVPTRVKKINH